ncbi:hypothetical protein NFIA_024060 [Paecilomyces variotii No. 5]|uniref:DUF4246 domain-containing protein n=1 Tax=Byssochlamys spectabilis (strain No. 5 / NBRC 109023) TaxID=1356009 RepID=V5FJH5_BYSSN|nr:hypothetical protein NFIA_024060 [Paecilomyces variotii No. 5]
MTDNRSPTARGLRPPPDKATDKSPDKAPDDEYGYWDIGKRVKPHFWSNRFQWLPCEVELSQDSKKAHIKSYINNLHLEHRDTYQAIEDLIAVDIQPWNEVLISGKQGRVPMRIRTYDVPTLHADENFWNGGQEFPNLYGAKRCSFTDEEWDQICSRAKNYLLLPEYPQEYQAGWYRYPDGFPEDILGSMTSDQWNSPRDLVKALNAKHRRRKIYELPEPSISFSYDDRKKHPEGDRYLLYY